MQTLRLIIAASGLALLLPATGFAQSADDIMEMTPEQRQEYLQGLSGEERKAMGDQRRAEWDAMPEEERNALRERRRAQWDAMSEEERQAARGRMSDRRMGKRGAMKENWKSMSEEERAAAREQYRLDREEHRRARENMSEEKKAAAREHRNNKPKQKKHQQ